MSEIAGYDVNGKTLHPGDKVILLSARDDLQHYVGKTFTVLEAMHEPILRLLIGENFIRLVERFPEVPTNPIADGKTLCKVDDDSRETSDQSYEQLIASLNRPKEVIES